MAQWDDSENQDPTAGASGPNLRDQGLYDAVARMYQQLLGRAPENPDVVWQYIDGRQGNIYAIQQDIAGSTEAKAYAAGQKPNPEPGPEPAQTPTTTLTPTPSPVPVPPPTTSTPPVDPAGGGGPAPAPGPGSGGADPIFPTFTPPTYTPPDPDAPPPYQPGGPFTPPPAFSFPDFSYDAFQAPTLDQAKNEPGYQFAMDQGRKALENSAAARGTLRTGGTLKDLFSWGNQFGEQNYGNVFNRELNVYGTNRNNAFQNYGVNRTNAADAYATNYGVSKDTFGLNNQQGLDTFDRNAAQGLNAYNTNKDTSLQAYDRNFQGAAAAFNPQFQAATSTFQDLYNRWRDKLNATTNIATAGAL